MPDTGTPGSIDSISQRPGFDAEAPHGIDRGDLPAVSPPSASFFVQLFLLPALILFGIMTVWYLFGKIAGSYGSPAEYVAIIKRADRADRWKAALDLSQLLRENSAYTEDRALAATLSDELDQALSASSKDSQFVEYLVGAVGSFRLPTGVPALARAARPDQDPPVRRASLVALANLAVRLGKLDDPDLRPAIESYLRDPDLEIRERSAMLLGKLRDPAAARALRGALDDPVASVRYQAATSLGELGSDAGMKTYVEMLDREQLGRRFVLEDDARRSVARPVERPENQDRGYKIDTIEAEPDRAPQHSVDEPLVAATMENALAALRALATQKPQVDAEAVLPSLQKLTADENPHLRALATELLRELSQNKGKSR